MQTAFLPKNALSGGLRRTSIARRIMEKGAVRFHYYVSSRPAPKGKPWILADSLDEAGNVTGTQDLALVHEYGAQERADAWNDGERQRGAKSP